MRRLNLYINHNLLIYLLIAMAIGTFMMLVGQFIKVFDLLAVGVDARDLLMIVVYRLPQVVSYTIPLGLFIAVVVVFNRMSAEHEITALRASGISLLQIVAPVIVLSIFLSGICAFLQFSMAPEYKRRSKWLVREAGVKSPLAFIAEGQFIEVFDGYIIYVGSKIGNRVEDVHIYKVNKKGVFTSRVTAAKGEINVDEAAKELELVLYSATTMRADPDNPYDVTKQQRGTGSRMTFPLSYGGDLKRKSLTSSPGEMTLYELLAHVQLNTEKQYPVTGLLVELHMRAAMALTPFSLVLIGIPFCIWQNRRDNNRSLFICMAIPLVYFVLISLFESFNSRPELHPDKLMWLPNIICQIGGAWGLWQRR